MSQPRDDYQRPVAGVIMEVMGALTALRMHPEPIEIESDRQDVYLCEADKWAAHAVEHLEAALVQLQKVQQLAEIYEKYVHSWR